MTDLLLSPVRFANWWVDHLTLLAVLVLIGAVVAPSLPIQPKGRQLPAWAGVLAVGVWLAGWMWVL